MKYRAAALAFAVIGCGSSAHGPREITLTNGSASQFSTPYLIYRDGSGPWQVPASKGNGTYTLVVTDTYEVFAA